MTQSSGAETSQKANQRSLILMRHAKSDWADHSLSDRDRPLNKRGRRDAPRMAQWLDEIGRVPELVLCSTAKRTCQTLELMLEVWEQSPEVMRAPDVIHCEDLYLAAPDEIFQEIRTFGGTAKSLMALAHNPGMSYAASMLADQSFDMPTAAIAVFDVEIDNWAAFHDEADRQFAQFMRPKALPET